MISDAATFLGIIVVLTVTPGADMALVMRNVLAYGFGSTWATLAGIFSGLAVHCVLCVAGLSVVLRNSDVAFATIKFTGAAWLVWLGVGALVAAVRAGRSPGGTEDAGAEPVAPAAGTPSARVLWRRGFLTNLLNVKIALFYIAFLPQFAPSGPAFVPAALGLATVQALIGFTWLLLYAYAVSRAGDALHSSPRVRRWLEGTTGAALIGFGARLATFAR